MEAAADAARQAAPGDPSLLSFLGEMRLHLDQRWGEQDDLRAAEKLYQQAAANAPANERLAAQLALIYRALGDQQAAEWAERARSLTTAGGHVERALHRVTPTSRHRRQLAAEPNARRNRRTTVAWARGPWGEVEVETVKVSARARGPRYGEGVAARARGPCYGGLRPCYGAGDVKLSAQHGSTRE